ncbi:hypothetical protein [Mesobacillus selenatarsenatis]|uniref:Uncharacterized protein n=1 Tax=Mesobacillus selenatarsenatis (strain DSM 18680 / JCM 14380 / FERM P-15431 / SF-1) TaxID=1321606 RepID=A0A0A8WZM5_MESS1|nr:hypothetical protein [Mesobacillus selenatarsenatis]GAM13195.1 BH2266 unknown [Mesobacillus selenatarsenatis SF-1]
MFVEGKIISGEFDQSLNEFSLQRVKSFETQSIFKECQMEAVYNYLIKHERDSDGQIVTLYDQMLVRLTQSEINELISDLERVKSLYH